MSARPTASPHRIELDIEAGIREFLGFTKERVKVDDPHAPQSLPGARFASRMHQFSGEFQNGSYFIIGQRDDSQTVEDSVPVLGDIPVLGRLFRASQIQKFTPPRRRPSHRFRSGRLSAASVFGGCRRFPFFSTRPMMCRSPKRSSFLNRSARRHIAIQCIFVAAFGPLPSALEIMYDRGHVSGSAWAKGAPDFV